MATQGVVSVVHQGRVVLKVIAGCDGYNAKKLSHAIRRLGRVPTLSEAYEMATNVGFGESGNLVVMDERRSKHNTGERLSRLYRRTFEQPLFNPRWKRGTADFVSVVKL